MSCYSGLAHLENQATDTWQREHYLRKIKDRRAMVFVANNWQWLIWVTATLRKLALPKSVDGDVKARDHSLRRFTPAVSQVLPDDLGDFEQVQEPKL